jgi:hypothetical protein
MNRRWGVAAVVLLLGISGVAAGSSRGIALRTDPGGGVLTGATTIKNTGAAPTVLAFSGVGVITCGVTQYHWHVNSNSGPVSNTGKATYGTFTSCTDTMPVITISSCTLSPDVSAPALHIRFSIPLSTVWRWLTAPFRKRCNVAGTTTNFCYYAASSNGAEGVGSNSADSITYTGEFITAVGGSGSLGALCGGTGSMSATLTGIVQSGTGTRVTVTTS